ncbi:MAG: T9SS type A sorting domain-containing protein [Prolixibacteraceae bacterium]|nr:T9SS type A sorting domain-containing protein [Prolixibacteraceae bacterium]
MSILKIAINSNNGRFTLSLKNLVNNVLDNVYNMVGASVYQSGFLQGKDVEINLPFARKGIYFVKVSGGLEQFIKKMIVN